MLRLKMQLHCTDIFFYFAPLKKQKWIQVRVGININLLNFPDRVHFF